MNLPVLGRAEKLEKIALLEEKQRRKLYNASKYYTPYAKQKEFHKLGASTSERALGAGNQLGKTLAGSMEAAYHATGEYPDWWVGQRFDKPTVGWVGGLTGESIVKTTQKLLIGRIQQGQEFMGTGSIPRSKILSIQPARGTPDLMDHVTVRHKTGGVSIIYFKSYVQGREKWQGDTVDWIWFDEEPPQEIYSEGRTRTNHGQKGTFAFLTFTPLLGMTEVVQRFYKSPNAQRCLTLMTIHDVDHYTEAEKQAIIDSYEPWEVEARTLGIPTLGEGKIFRLAEKDIKEPHISEIPKHWALLNGIDFGWDHPQAVVQIAWDRDDDVIHVLRAARSSHMTPLMMWGQVKHWVKNIPCAWPPDGLQTEKGSGEQVKAQYEDAGFTMLHEHATHEEGGVGVEAGIMEMQERFRTNRLKIDETLDEFFEEYRLYHRDKGKIVKLNDDILSATRYAIMMKRFAETHEEMNPEFIEPVFPNDMPR